MTYFGDRWAQSDFVQCLLRKESREQESNAAEDEVLVARFDDEAHVRQLSGHEIHHERVDDRLDARHDLVHEISRAVVRTIVAVAEHYEDRLRNISIMTLAEILVKEPELVYHAGGFAILHDALAEGTFGASESLIGSFLHVLDTPHSRKHLRGGCELEAVLAPFTDSLSDTVRNGRLKSSAKAISAMLKTWPGLVVLARNGAKPLQSLLDSLHYPDPQARDLIMELLFDALRIKPPSWSSSFLAGRRLTTYGRVANLRSDSDAKLTRGYYDDRDNQFDLTAHFSTLILATLVDAGLSQVRCSPAFLRTLLTVTIRRSPT